MYSMNTFDITGLKACGRSTRKWTMSLRVRVETLGRVQIDGSWDGNTAEPERA